MSLLRQGPGVFFAFCAFVLLIIVSVGNPIWDVISFLRLGNDQTAGLRLGQWGYTFSTGNGVWQSSGTRLGYRADDAIDLFGQTGDISGAITHGLTYALILHPIAAAFALLTILISLTTVVALDILGSLLAFFTFLICAVAFIIDSVLFVIGRNRINRVQAGSPATLGPAYWLVLSATILMLLASFTICFGSRHARKEKHRREAMASQPVYAEQPVMQEKRRFWQRRAAY